MFCFQSAVVLWTVQFKFIAWCGNDQNWIFLIVCPKSSRVTYFLKIKNLDFFYGGVFGWLSHRNLKIFIELLPQMKDFLELMGSERPNLSAPQWLRKLYILMNMTRRLNTLNPRLQGNKRALLICSKHVVADSMWTCGRSRWQLGMVLASHARTFGAQNSQRFWRIAELINPAMDENNIIISEEIHRVYWIQIMLMSVLSLAVLSRCVYTSKFYTLSIVQFHEKGCVDCAHPGNKVFLKISLTR